MEDSCETFLTPTVTVIVVVNQVSEATTNFSVTLLVRETLLLRDRQTSGTLPSKCRTISVYIFDNNTTCHFWSRSGLGLKISIETFRTGTLSSIKLFKTPMERMKYYL